jgi:hypothetical protein
MTLTDVINEALSLPVYVPGKTLVLYSGLAAPNAEGYVFNSEAALQIVSDAPTQFYTIFDTPAGMALDDGIFETLPAGGFTSSQLEQIKQAWVTLSQRVAAQATGPVIACVAGAVSPIDIFGATEYPALLDNNKVGWINGIPTASLSTNPDIAIPTQIGPAARCYNQLDPNVVPQTALVPFTSPPYTDAALNDTTSSQTQTAPPFVQEPAGSGSVGVSLSTADNFILAVGGGILLALTLPEDVVLGAAAALLKLAQSSATVSPTPFIRLSAGEANALQPVDSSASLSGADFLAQGSLDVESALSIVPDIAFVPLADAVAMGTLPASDLSQFNFTQSGLSDVQTLLAGSTQPLTLQVPVSSSNTVSVTVKNADGGLVELDTSGSNADGSTFSTTYDSNPQSFGQASLSINEINGTETSSITATGIGPTGLTEDISYTSGSISASEQFSIPQSFDIVQGTIDGVTLNGFAAPNPSNLSFGPGA